VQADLNLSGLKIGPQTFIVVSTQGECDEEALERALQTPASYVAFVASKVKAAKVLQYLGEREIGVERLNQARAPAGLSIGADSPEEIAVSILAEIIQLSKSRATGRKDTEQKQEAKDPICGMTVGIATAKYKSEFDGKSFYFCCAGCKQTFDRQPDKVVSQ
jgi:xanthine dehydrogenase accessory factor